MMISCVSSYRPIFLTRAQRRALAYRQRQKALVFAALLIASISGILAMYLLGR